MIKGKLKMTSFIDALEQQSNLTTTENGAITHASSTSYCTDFFATGGALRSRSPIEMTSGFLKAFSENHTFAVRLAFMFRDIRGGQGQREPFRQQLQWLANNYPTETAKLLPLVAEYGRWDDLYSVIDTPIRVDMLNVIGEQVLDDLAGMLGNEPISLVGKWLKRINTSSKESVRIGHIIRKHLGFDEKTYRKTCSTLNEYLNVVENKMASNRWDQINYEQVPGQCLLKRRKAFDRHDTERYQEFVTKAQNGEVNVNAKTLYPYQVIDKILNRHHNDITVAEAEMFWKNLANFEVDPNALVVADVSGSMEGMPLNVCISLALYFSERAKGVFNNRFITFSKSPKLQSVVGENIFDRVNSINTAQWDMNTNLEAVFNLVLNSAVNFSVPADEMVKTLYIISDMEFDSCVNCKSSQVETFYDTMKVKFINAGYRIPRLVFWNVNARNDNNFPVTKNTENTCMISGFSPSVLQYLDTGILPTTEEMMLTVVNSERYNKIEF